MKTTLIKHTNITLHLTNQNQSKYGKISFNSERDYQVNIIYENDELTT